MKSHNGGIHRSLLQNGLGICTSVGGLAPSAECTTQYAQSELCTCSACAREINKHQLTGPECLSSITGLWDPHIQKMSKLLHHYFSSLLAQSESRTSKQ